MTRCVSCGAWMSESDDKYDIQINDDYRPDPNGFKTGKCCEECAKEIMFGEIA